MKNTGMMLSMNTRPTDQPICQGQKCFMDMTIKGLIHFQY